MDKPAHGEQLTLALEGKALRRWLDSQKRRDGAPELIVLAYDGRTVGSDATGSIDAVAQVTLRRGGGALRTTAASLGPTHPARYTPLAQAAASAGSAKASAA